MFAMFQLLPFVLSFEPFSRSHQQAADNLLPNAQNVRDFAVTVAGMPEQQGLSIPVRQPSQRPRHRFPIEFLVKHHITARFKAVSGPRLLRLQLQVTRTRRVAKVAVSQARRHPVQPGSDPAQVIWRSSIQPQKRFLRQVFRNRHVAHQLRDSAHDRRVMFAKQPSENLWWFVL
jgi:hypothetical protein